MQQNILMIFLIILSLSASSAIYTQDATQTIRVNPDTLTVIGDSFVELAPHLLDIQFTLMSMKMTITETK